jgi:hypothetical protein
MSSSDSPTIVQLLKQLRQDIETSQEEMRDQDQDAAFFLEDIEVEAKFTVSGSGKAGIQIHIVNIGGEVKSEHVHTLKLKLKPSEKYVKIAHGKTNRVAPNP